MRNSKLLYLIIIFFLTAFGIFEMIKEIKLKKQLKVTHSELIITENELEAANDRMEEISHQFSVQKMTLRLPCYIQSYASNCEVHQKL